MKDNRVDVGPAATIVPKVGVYWAHLILNFDQLYEMQNIFVTGKNEKQNFIELNQRLSDL